MQDTIRNTEQLLLIWQFIAIVSSVLLVLLAFANIKLRRNNIVYFQETIQLINTSNKYLKELVALRKLYKEQSQEFNLLKEEKNEEENYN